MKKIGFIGAYDKTDMILNIAKIMTTMGNRVLVIDSTLNQKAKYIVPVINPTTSYITNFEDIDVAVGFDNPEQIKQYLGISGEETNYDICLIDVDSIDRIKKFNITEADKNFFVTAFDLYSLKKGLEILSELKEPMSLTKILFAKEVLKEDDDYLNFLSLGYKVIWDEERIYFPIENGDWTAITENQRVAKIKFRKLSAQYKDSLTFIVLEALNASETSVRRAMKIIERGV